MARPKIRLPKAGQLRVRITDAEREALEMIVQERGGSTTLSDVIRDALEIMLDPQMRPLIVDRSTAERLQRLGKILNRAPEAVLSECVAGVEDQYESDENLVPLIVQECKLRRDYDAKKKGNAGSGRRGA